MIIRFYLDDENETDIFTLDVEFNPFKVGDVVNLSVDEPLPNDYSRFRDIDAQLAIRKRINEQIEMYNYKKVKILREGIYVGIRPLHSNRLTIEYHCEFIND